MKIQVTLAVTAAMIAAGFALTATNSTVAQKKGQPAAVKSNPTTEALADIAKLKVGKHDWPQWGGWYGKNNGCNLENIKKQR